jgi:nitrogenase molybdenum-iron protein alpha/beta subunit
MPIELESGHLQLTDEEIPRYRLAAALVSNAFRDSIPLHGPMTCSQFVSLHLAQSIVNGDDELMHEITAMIENEIAKRGRLH